MKSKLWLNVFMRAVVIQGILFLGNGCSRSSSSSGGSANSTATSATKPETQLLVANSILTNGTPVYASPANGGLVGNLYIQPRNFMLAPDTQVVGCGQYGSGALGLDNYLSQPSWINQSLIFTDIYVPAENFLVGFPAPGGNGAVLPVDSFFAIDTFGSFHLGIGDTEGYYEFSLIADDSARLKLGNPDGSYSMLIDDEKPSSYNNGTCLAQTQSAHMSCTTNWSNQTAAQVKTVYLRPGDLLPMELSYWQGPGGGIAVMAFYRKVADPTNASQVLDPACGKEWDFSANGTDLQNLKKTWTPIGLQNLNPLPQ